MTSSFVFFSAVALMVSLFCFGPSMVAAIFQPTVGASFYIDIQSGDSINQNVAASIYDVDLDKTSASTIASLQAKGIHVICYFSAGTKESFRPDASQFPSSVLGNNDTRFSPNQPYLDLRQISTLFPIMKARIDNAKSKGCDGVDLDNVGIYGNATSGTNTGFDLTVTECESYYLTLTNYTHSVGLAVSLKNSPLFIPSVVSDADFVIEESCFYQNSLDQGAHCNDYFPFITANKPVFAIEYFLKPTDFCRRSNKFKFFGGVYQLSLNGSVIFCTSIATLAVSPSLGAASPSLGASTQATPSGSLAPSVAPTPSASLAPSVAATPSGTVAATGSASLVASPTNGGSNNICITCGTICTGSNAKFTKKCASGLLGSFFQLNNNTICCNNAHTSTFSFSWHEKGTSCSGSISTTRKLYKLCVALGVTPTCRTQTRVPTKVTLTCAK